MIARLTTTALLCVALLPACQTTRPEDLQRANMHRRLAEAKLLKNATELAIREYRAAIELAPDNPESHFGLAEAYRRKGLLAEAEASLLEALRLAPEHHDARLNLSAVYLLDGRFEDAIRETTILIEEPTFLRPSRALVNRGWAHYRSGRLEQAERDLKEALITDEGNFQAHLDLGLLLLDRGELPDAMIHLRRVLIIIKGRPPAIFGAAEAQARFHLAKAHVKLGQRERAIAELRAAIERGGGTEWARKSQEYLTVLE